MATIQRIAACAFLAALLAGLSGSALAQTTVVIGEFSDPFDEFADCPTGWTCTPGFPTASFLVNFPDPNDIQRGALQLTPNVGGLAGSAFHNTPFNIQTNRFTAEFDVFLDGASDGMTFAVINAATNTASYVGGGGGGLGWGGNVQGFAVEFDIHENGGTDPDDNHVGVNLNGSLLSEGTSSSAAGPGIDLCALGFDLGAATIYSVVVEYDNGHIVVRMSGGNLPDNLQMLEANLPLFPSAQALFGFTGGTGGGSAQQVVDNFKLTLNSGVSTPPPVVVDPLSVPFAVNCGSGARVAGAAVTFEPDQRYRAGATSYGWVGTPGQNPPESAGPPACDDAVLPLNAGADDQGLRGMYETARVSDSYENFGYRFLIPNGTYEVTIYGAELAALYPAFSIDQLLDALQCYGNPRKNGLRRMDVIAEGIKVLDDFAFAELAGDEFLPASMSFVTSVTDGLLAVDFAIHDFGTVEDLGGPAVHGIKIDAIDAAAIEALPVAVDADTLIFQDGRALAGGGMYDGTRDTYVMEKNPDNNNGKSDLLEVGRTGPETAQEADPDDDRSALVKFTNLDVSAVGDRRLANATITLQYHSTRPTDDDQIAFQVNGDDYAFGHCPHLTVPVGARVPLPPCAGLPSPTIDLCAGDTKTVNVHRVLTPWSEGSVSERVDGAADATGGATWNRPQGAQSAEWGGANAGGHVDDTVLASMELTEPVQAELGVLGAGGLFSVVEAIAVPPNFEIVQFESFRTVTIDVTELAQGWLDGTIPNEGIVLREEPGNEAIFKGTRIFKSREHPSIVDRPSLTLVFEEAVVGDPPELVAVMGGLGSSPDTFIGPLGEGAELTTFGLTTSIPLETLTAEGSAYTADGPAPTIASFVSNGDGTHAVTLDAPVAAGHWLRLDLEAAGAGTRTGAFSVWLGRLPLDINQDGIANIRDATAFGDQFRGAQEPRLIDVNGDGTVNIRDATAFGNNWNGISPATQSWRNARLPDKP